MTQDSPKKNNSDIAHDLRTPLTSLFGYIQLLQSKTTNEQHKDWLSKMNEQCVRLDALITTHLSSTE